ncbi:hypothetical protein FB45DRAFT_906342 [Roridomyces roridus]|uniref:F-box domain-containing protein n=1 Tax=Roridomyces roridus TaxID=1738132 RepID=A0AAD7FS40_9AGAR|nr:hypothetical protein FB45DRAFT_906342 [Roridomyces roridus]
MSAAQELVISTPELLTCILTQLPMRDLLVTVPLVSKTWQAITQTPEVQRLLFFEPSTDSSSSPAVQNPLLAELFPPFFAPERQDTRFHHSWMAHTIKAMPWSKAPWAFNRANASWRRMLVTQPPARKIIVVQTHSYMRGKSVSRATLEDGPVRMGRMYDLAVPWVASIASWFCVLWPGMRGAEAEADITFLRGSVQQCAGGGKRQLDQIFFSEGRKEVQLVFSQPVSVRH